MNELLTLAKVSQSDIFEIQDLMLQCEPMADEVEHFFADGVYGRILKVPADTYIVGKAHRQAHLSILLKGTITVTNDDGAMVTLTAPSVFVVPAGKKKLGYAVDEMWFMNIHPTDTQDIDVIESRVIIPEQEYRALLESQKHGLIDV